MKKLFTLATALLLGSSLSFAQENLIVNGNFEDTGFDVFSFEGKQVSNVIVGWDLLDSIMIDGVKVPCTMDNIRPDAFNNAGIDQWSVYPYIWMHDDGDDTGDYQYLRMQRYAWNGWGGYRDMMQTINIESGASYLLKFRYRLSYTNNDKGPEPLARGIVTMHDSQGGKLDYQLDLENMLDPELWTWVEMEVPALDDDQKATIGVGMDGAFPNPWDSNLDENMKRADFDDVSFVKLGDASAEKESVSSVKVYATKGLLNIEGAKIGEPIRIYTAGGMLIKSIIASSANFSIDMKQDFYLVKADNKVTKIVIE